MGKNAIDFRNMGQDKVDAINAISELIQAQEMSGVMFSTGKLEAEIASIREDNKKLETGTKSHTDNLLKIEEYQQEVDTFKNKNKLVKDYINHKLNSYKATKTRQASVGLYDRFFLNGRIYEAYEEALKSYSWKKYEDTIKEFISEAFGFKTLNNKLCRNFGNLLAHAAGVKVVSGKKCLEGQNIKPLSPSQWNKVMFRTVRDYVMNNNGTIENYLGADWKLEVEFKDSKVRTFEVVRKNEAEKKAEAEVKEAKKASKKTAKKASK